MTHKNQKNSKVEQAFITYLNRNLNELMKVGDGRVKLFAKIGIRTFKDLLFHLPYDYVNRSYSPLIHEMQKDDLVTLELTVTEVSFNNSIRSKAPSKIFCENESGFVTLIYFNKIPPYIKQNFLINSKIIVSGKIDIQSEGFVIIHPDIVVKSNERYKIPVIEPIYLKVEGLTSKLIWSLAQKILPLIPTINEWLPQELIAKKGWKSFVESLKILHKPSNLNINNLKIARDRLAFDEVLAHQICLKLLRKKLQQGAKNTVQFSGQLVNDLLKNLGFQLTKEQQMAVKAIEQDQLSDKKMLRLLMGDVGCGKTLVALCAALNAIESKKQVAFMVPTEILANQHYKNITRYVEKLGINLCLLLGNTKAEERRQILEKLQNGEIDTIIGTHALFQDKVTFANLGLVIIDEQHRFGVKQRMSLLQKGENADLLMLSATPIPRTISMLSYGDMDVSIIKNKPVSNKAIVTTILSKSKIAALLDRIKAIIQKGERVYWVCPLIEESEKLQLSYVENSFAVLIQSLGDNVAMLHGKMKPEEREKVMQEFKEGKKTVIVATTVIEVGIDVPEATIMVIENAERFGLSQLHQLRGRVGRGSAASYCVLLHGHKVSLVSKKRLNILKNFSDGFRIAEKDLEIRGSGDYLGFRQSGESGFKFFDPLKNGQMVDFADNYASSIVTKYPNPIIKILLQLFDKDMYFAQHDVTLT
uniref:ATP-dependent DNA helicase RecG n=1 Tax=Candidatus Bandiella euplotis TaxID=1664265 RepID=UPI00389906C6